MAAVRQPHVRDRRATQSNLIWTNFTPACSVWGPCGWYLWYLVVSVSTSLSAYRNSNRYKKPALVRCHWKSRVVETLSSGITSRPLLRSVHKMVRATWKKLLNDASVQRSSQTLSIVGTDAFVYGGELRPREPVDSAVYRISVGSGKRRMLSGTIESGILTRYRWWR
jgi:hypothetical protein